MSRAYCNLGLAHLATGNHESVLECQKYFLAIAQTTKESDSRFRALGNMGDVLIKMDSLEEAIEVYHKQLALSKQLREKSYEASSYGSLGICHRLTKQFDKALGIPHTGAVNLAKDLGDLQGECKAHGNMGAVHLSLSNYINAVKCYTEQLERAQEISDGGLEAAAYGNLGRAKHNLGRHEEAVHCFQQQVELLEEAKKGHSLERGRALGHIGTCHSALNNHKVAATYHQEYLAMAVDAKSPRDQERAYRDLGSALRNTGNLQEALVCFEKRLVMAHDLVQLDDKGSAYGELGEVHSLLGNLEQAASCLEHQLKTAREAGDRCAEARAASALGLVLNDLGRHSQALSYHRQDLSLSTACQNNMEADKKTYRDLHELIVGPVERAPRFE